MSLFICIITICMLTSKTYAEDAPQRICLINHLLQNYTMFLDQVEAAQANPDSKINFDDGLKALRVSIGHCDVVKLEDPVELEELLLIFKRTIDDKLNVKLLDCIKGILIYVTNEIKGSALDYIKHSVLYAMEMAILGTGAPLEIMPKENVHFTYIIDNCQVVTTTILPPETVAAVTDELVVVTAPSTDKIDPAPDTTQQSPDITEPPPIITEQSADITQPPPEITEPALDVTDSPANITDQPADDTTKTPPEEINPPLADTTKTPPEEINPSLVDTTKQTPDVTEPSPDTTESTPDTTASVSTEPSPNVTEPPPIISEPSPVTTVPPPVTTVPPPVTTTAASRGGFLFGIFNIFG